MKPLVPTADFPKRDDFIYLNAANVALMYEGCRTAISDWYNDVAFNGSNNFNELAEADVFDSIHDLAAQLLILLLDPVPQNYLVPWLGPLHLKKEKILSVPISCSPALYIPGSGLQMLLELL